jgi:hypothetical protein
MNMKLVNVATLIARMNGTQSITQRINHCTCGCGGKDHMHARTIKRAVRNVTMTVDVARTFEGHSVDIIARGEYKRADVGTLPCVLTVYRDADAITVLGWTREG